ncbi:ORF106 [Leucania separata nucleopolyhedrovirus]|uniref:ORF106 n=1 Tax=Leucania separata nucleopolyhedrovirus TaxID=1307956 RepID=Q0IL13_NPVLS|nr:ORF106 [Leucania separata nucleopolyhedrovirus]AAR28870.1 ORF106 [Leucania separata nucleopolyhedrovirus]
MSSVMLFLEIENLKNKIDKRMNMGIWPKFFPLLVDPQASIQLTIDEINDFLVTTARVSEIDRTESNVAITSQFANAIGGGGAAIVPPAAAPPPAVQPSAAAGIFNIFKQPTTQSNRSALSSADSASFQRKCQKILQYYTSAGTTSTDFKISDLVACMVFLSNSSRFRALFNLLRTSMTSDYECMPPLGDVEVQNLIDALRELTGMTAYSVNFEALRMLKVTLGKVMNYPIAKYPRVVIAETYRASHDQQTSLEELILDRYDGMKRMETQFVTLNNAKILQSTDTALIDHLLKRNLDEVPVERMFYNSVNAIFYATMENYAVSNCKFVVSDYNNIFKTVDDVKTHQKNSLFAQHSHHGTNISLQKEYSMPSSSSSSSCKRKRQ